MFSAGKVKAKIILHLHGHRPCIIGHSVDYPTTILIALGLSMDAFAVSVSEGIVLKKGRVKNALKLAISFGSFQAIMPVVGWLAGLGLKQYIVAFDHWIAFALLVLIGIKMIYESAKECGLERAEPELRLHRLFLLSIATSIDALAVGISFSFLNIDIITPIIIIAAITFVNSFVGYLLGERIGTMFGSRVGIAGGIILIGIGAKILIEHL